MTREEAIEQLNNVRDLISEEAADMAIEALQAKTEGDLISRQWLLDLYGTYIDGDVKEGKALFVPLEVVRQNIKDAPSAYPKTGEWVRTTEEINDCDGHRAYYWYECDNCGARPPKDRWGNEWHSDFCPNCGCAMMEGGDSE